MVRESTGSPGKFGAASLAIYGLLFLAELAERAFVPLLPSYAERLALSELEAAALLGASSLAIVLISLPIGLQSDRAGPRVLTLVGAIALIAGSLGLAFAIDFWSLLCARGAQGVGLGALWTAGLAWLATAPARTGVTRLIAGTISVASLAHIVGPATAGNLADQFGRAVPFLLIAGFASLCTLTLIPARSRVSRTGEDLDLASGVRGLWRDSRLVGAFTLMIGLGITGGVVSLLVPLQLADNGATAGEIGLILSAGAVIVFASSVLTTSLGARAVRLVLVSAVLLAMGATTLLPITMTTTVALVAFVLVRAPCAGFLTTVTYPLGELGARGAAIGVGLAFGLLNVTWGLAAATGPILGGGIVQAAGESLAYVAIAVVAVTSAVMMLLLELRQRGRGSYPCSDETRSG